MLIQLITTMFSLAALAHGAPLVPLVGTEARPPAYKIKVGDGLLVTNSP